MSDGMGREFTYLSSHATNRYFIPNWGLLYQIKQIIRLRPYPKPAVYYMHDSIICPMTDLRL